MKELVDIYLHYMNEITSNNNLRDLYCILKNYSLHQSSEVILLFHGGRP